MTFPWPTSEGVRSDPPVASSGADLATDLRVMVAPAVVLLLGDLSGLQLGGLFRQVQSISCSRAASLFLQHRPSDRLTYLVDLDPIVSSRVNRVCIGPHRSLCPGQKAHGARHPVPQPKRRSDLPLGFLILFHIVQGVHQQTSPGSPVTCQDIFVSSPQTEKVNSFTNHHVTSTSKYMIVL